MGLLFGAVAALPRMFKRAVGGDTAFFCCNMVPKKPALSDTVAF